MEERQELEELERSLELQQRIAQVSDAIADRMKRELGQVRDDLSMHRASGILERLASCFRLPSRLRQMVEASERGATLAGDLSKLSIFIQGVDAANGGELTFLQELEAKYLSVLPETEERHEING